MRSKAAFLGHPVHPMLIAFPIAGFTATVLADVAYFISGGLAMWYDIAFWSAVFGVVMGIVAGVAGVTDYLGVVRRTNARTTGLAHGLLNSSAILLFLVSVLIRIGIDPPGSAQFIVAFVLGLVGLGAVGVSGWLGGELVYRHHIGMVPDTTQMAEEEGDYHDYRRAA